MLYPEDYIGVDDDAMENLGEAEAFALAEYAAILKDFENVDSDQMFQSVERVNQRYKKAKKQSEKDTEEIFTILLYLSNQNDQEKFEDSAIQFDFDDETVQDALNSTEDEISKTFDNIGYTSKLATGKTQFNSIYAEYNNAVTDARMKVNSGLIDHNTALKEAVRRCAASGIKTVKYDSGVVNRVDVALKRAIRTGVNQMSADLNDKTAQTLGTDYVEVTAHIGARPSHKIWQGKVYKIHGSDDKYPNLADSTGLGTPGGLLGCNCRHNYYAFIPGISGRAYSDEFLKTIDPPDFQYNGKTYTYYAATQRQRAIETSIRETKRRLLMYDKLGLKDEYVTESLKLQMQRKEYRAFSSAAGIRAKNERHWTFGFDKKAAAKARQAAESVKREGK